MAIWPKALKGSLPVSLGIRAATRLATSVARLKLCSGSMRADSRGKAGWKCTKRSGASTDRQARAAALRRSWSPLGSMMTTASPRNTAWVTSRSKRRVFHCLKSIRISPPRSMRGLLVVSPADAIFKGHWPIDEQSEIEVKGVKWSIHDLLDGSPYQDAFKGGIYTHSFLYVNDYHRYHVPVGGAIKEVRNIHGKVFLDRSDADERRGVRLFLVRRVGYRDALPESATEVRRTGRHPLSAGAGNRLRGVTDSNLRVADSNKITVC
jgi:hypothetical protein